MFYNINVQMSVSVNDMSLISDWGSTFESFTNGEGTWQKRRCATTGDLRPSTGKLRAVYQNTILLLYRYSSIDILYNISYLQHVIPHFMTLLSSKLKKTFQNMTKYSHMLAAKYVSVRIIHNLAIKRSKRWSFFTI